MMPDSKVAVGTRRGEIWMIENALLSDPKEAKFTRFAHGLHEVLGLAQKDGWLYVVHRPEVTKIKDTNGDGKADVFETGHRRLGSQRRLPRVRLRLSLRQGRQHLDRPVPHRFVQLEQQVPRLGRQGDPGRQVRADDQRRPLPRRRRLQRGRRRLLHRQPGALERRLRPQGDHGRRLHRPSRQLQVVQGARGPVPRQGPERPPRAAAGR